MKISFLLEFIFKRAERQLQEDSLSIKMFLLEPVNVASGVTGEFVRLGVTEFVSSDVIIAIVELLANSIREADETMLFLFGQNES